MNAMRGNPLDDEFLRVRLVFAGMLVALIFLGGWLWHLQVHRGASFEQDQLKQSVRRVRIPGVRGRLFDRKDNCVADNRASYNIVLYLEELRKPGKWDRTLDHVLAQLDALGQVLGTPSELDRDKLRAHIRRSLPLPLVAWRDVSEEVLARFAERANQIPGVDIQVDNVRLYPFGPRACHALGYVGRAEIEQDEEQPYHYYLPEMTGRSGLEKSLDETLRGEAGGRLLRVDATGFRRYDSGQREPRSGQDVQLTLDMRVQALAEDALGQVPGSVVVIDPRNGDVLALASNPGFDPNTFVPRISTEQWKTLNEDPLFPLVNRAVAGGYAPGSTFKPVTALAGLQHGGAQAMDVHSCPGYYQLGSATFRCWYHSGHGPLHMRQALERSCNVYFFHVGLQTGVEHLADEARTFGLGRKTGIELDYELAGQCAGYRVEAADPAGWLARWRHLQHVHRAGRPGGHPAANGQPHRHPGQRGTRLPSPPGAGRAPARGAKLCRTGAGSGAPDGMAGRGHRAGSQRHARCDQRGVGYRAQSGPAQCDHCG